MNGKLVGQRILEGRRELALSQSEFAYRLNVTAQAVGKWERGESLPDIIMLTKIADIFQVDLNFFVDASKNTEKPNRQESDKKMKKSSRNISFSTLKDGDFTGYQNKSKIQLTNIIRSKFIKANLSETIFQHNRIEDSDFTDADISGTRLDFCTLVRNDFSNTNFKNAIFTWNEFKDSKIKDANLDGAEFTYCTFKETLITGKVENATFAECGFKNSGFKNSELINVFFKGRGLKKLGLENCKVDQITLSFLKNAKVDLTGVTLI